MQAKLGQRRQRRRSGGQSSLGAGSIHPLAENDVVRVAIRAAVAAGTYAVQDLRDRDGATRALLRRAALGLAASERPALRALGATYLRGDPPAGRLRPPTTGDQDGELIVDIDPATVTEVSDER